VLRLSRLLPIGVALVVPVLAVIGCEAPRMGAAVQAFLAR